MDMTIAEKVSYIKGLAEGMKVDGSTDEGKVINAMLDVLADIAVSIEGINDGLEDLADVVADLEEDVCELQDEVYDTDGVDTPDFDSYDDDGEEDDYEICCPECGTSFSVTPDVISSGGVTCINCGQELKFDFDYLEDDDED